MKVGLNPVLNDVNIDAHQTSSKRQLEMSIRAIADAPSRNVP